MAKKLAKKKKVIEVTQYAIDRVVVARDGEVVLVNYTEGTTRTGPKGEEHYRPLLGGEMRLCAPGIEPPLEDMEDMTAEEMEMAKALFTLIKQRLEKEYREEV